MDFVLVEIIALLGGFFLLARGSDALVEGGERIAFHYNVSPLTIGLTVVAWGTSLPELVITTWSSMSGNAGESLGTVVGSNVANLGLVLGACAIILPATIENRVRVRDGFWLLASLCVVWATLHDGVVSRMDGGILLACFLYYEYGLLKSGKVEVPDIDAKAAAKAPMGPAVLKVILGSAAIAIGARTAMFGGEGLANRIGMAPEVVGLTVFAVGTSLPELFAGISSARRGHAEMGLGNVLGSNVFNVLAALGCAALAKPISSGTGEVQTVMTRDIPIALGFSVMLLILPFLPRVWGRAKGSVVLFSYVAYVAYLIWNTL